MRRRGGVLSCVLGLSACAPAEDPAADVPPVRFVLDSIEDAQVQSHLVEPAPPAESVEFTLGPGSRVGPADGASALVMPSECAESGSDRGAGVELPLSLFQSERG